MSLTAIVLPGPPGLQSETGSLPWSIALPCDDRGRRAAAPSIAWKGQRPSPARVSDQQRSGRGSYYTLLMNVGSAVPRPGRV